MQQKYISLRICECYDQDTKPDKFEAPLSFLVPHLHLHESHVNASEHSEMLAVQHCKANQDTDTEEDHDDSSSSQYSNGILMVYNKNQLKTP